MAIMIAPSVLLAVVFLASSAHVRALGELVELDENSWSQLLEGEWMVEFFAPWCPACKALGPVWNDFSKWSKDLGVKVAHVDVTTNPGLSGRFMVTALPTIYHVKDGEFRQYRGTRDKESFINFIEEKKWQSIDPVSTWKSPQSIQMSMVAQFFKLSMSLRALHTTLVDYYGIPYWGSYILFALGTIIIGAVLGLLIVCIIDTVFPAKLPTYKPVKKSESDNEEEEGESESEGGNKSDDDVILDDTLDEKDIGDGEGAQLRRRNPEAVE
ncbi:thioredoxin-related transmembrane protein 1 [Dermacentor albipictus]|uniref:thioredoxin-related transmembrane protein 1 n=1 Tax=Dermacentor albipictus TaxID=60249 RepID=UPI0031FDEB7D